MKKSIVLTLLSLSLVCGLIGGVRSGDARLASRHIASGSSTQAQLNLSINDVAVTEGTDPTAVFTVTLNFPVSRDFTTRVDFATSNGTAADPGDYTQSSGTLIFGAGQSPATRTISIPIVDDSVAEPSENFTVTLSNPSVTAPIPISISRANGVCTILDNDGQPPTLPTLSIGDVMLPEGNAGTTNAVFTVSLSSAPSSQVTVSFATADGLATVADNDYISASGALTFPSGVNAPMTISVAVVGDARAEGIEDFFVNLSNPSGATIADGQGVGKILDDDQVPGCAYTVEPASRIHGPAGTGDDFDNFTLISPPGCAWEIKSEVGWIGISSTPRGVGNKTVNYTVAPNENRNGSPIRREGIINIMPSGSSTPAAVFTVIQDGLSCTFSVSPPEAVAEADGDIVSISVTAPEGCKWSTESRSSDFVFLFGTPLDPSGNGIVSYEVAVNKGSFRSATVRVAGKDVSIYQNTRDCPEEFVCLLFPFACFRPGTQSGSDMLGTSRQFRDKVLARSARGQRYTRLYYDFSGEIVRQMIFRPSLVLRSLEVKERYLPFIEAMVKGAEVTLTQGDIEEIDSFLKAIAERGSRELQEAIKGVRADLRDPRAHAEFRVKVILGPKRDPKAPLAPVRTLAMSDREAQAPEAFAKLPMRFELNQGQTDSQVKFIARGPGYGLFLTPNEATLRLRHENRGSRIEDRGSPPRSSIFDPRPSVLRMRLAGANPAPKITGLDELPGKTNYFTGQDRSRWRANVPSFARVKYENVYKGVDLVYYGNQGQLEYDFIVAPGADPSAIRLAIDGAEKIEIDASGDLALHTPGGLLRQLKPRVYQEENGTRREIPSRYTILDPRSSILDPQVAFEVGDYDATKPLIIDPVLVYSTYLGGSGIDEGASIAVDPAGQVYVAGFTESLDFPLANAAQSSARGGQDAFVAKLNAAGTQLIYATYLGGSGQDNAVSIATDAAGAAYVTGFTASPNFPALNAVQPVRKGPNNSFVTKLNPAGGVIYSTYLGGSRADFGSSVTADAAGNVYVTGITASPDFPMANALQPAFGGVSDVYVAKLDSSGARLLFSTYLGGAATDGGTSVAVDSAGNVYVAGVTNSADLRTVNPLQSRNGGGLSDSFVAKLNPIGSELVYATYLGGSRVDRIFRLAVDAAGNAYVTGDTDSSDFPTANAQQPSMGGGTDAFVAKINPTGSALVYSTYLGGDRIDGGAGIAVDPSGNVTVTGYTSSANFPTFRPVQQTNGAGSSDAFVARLDQQGLLNYSTYLGGRGSDTGFGVAVDASGNTYVMGLTDSTNFPLANPLQMANGGAEDIFIAKLDPVPTTPIITDAEILRNGRLLVIGKEFELGAQVLLNGQPLQTRNDLFNPSTRLVVSEIALREIRPGRRVTLQARNPDGLLSPEFMFTWPLRRTVTER
ncbi:MAG: SBBP repeat-containing protein [Acidobacteria bacterium]|nr:SBBP repeat-containing protein [Acidobacteriota bacterium]